jgi:hypothetical protein
VQHSGIFSKYRSPGYLEQLDGWRGLLLSKTGAIALFYKRLLDGRLVLSLCSSGASCCAVVTDTKVGWMGGLSRFSRVLLVHCAVLL